MKMDTQTLSRQKLESYSTQDLLDLADEYGIDIPEDLNRRFIIEEILESVQEQEYDLIAGNEVTFTDDEVNISSSLPTSYNETKIHAIVHDPSWIFVYWDISAYDLENIRINQNFKSLLLHVVFYDSEGDERPSDSIDIKVSLEDRMQYVLISSQKKIFAVNLVVNNGSIQRTIAHTPRINITNTCSHLNDLQPGKKIRMSPLVKLSGMDDLLKEYYLTHRESLNNQ